MFTYVFHILIIIITRETGLQAEVVYMPGGTDASAIVGAKRQGALTMKTMGNWPPKNQIRMATENIGKMKGAK